MEFVIEDYLDARALTDLSTAQLRGLLCNNQRELQDGFVRLQALGSEFRRRGLAPEFELDDFKAHRSQ